MSAKLYSKAEEYKRVQSQCTKYDSTCTCINFACISINLIHYNKNLMVIIIYFAIHTHVRLEDLLDVLLSKITSHDQFFVSI